MTNPTINGNFVKFRVSGKYDGFEIYLNGSSTPYKTYKTSSATDISIDINQF